MQPTVRPRNRLFGVVLILLAGAAVAAFTQQAAALEIARWVASLFVSVLTAVLQMVGAIFGAH